MRIASRATLFFALFTLSAFSVAEIKPAISYTTAGIWDSSFNQAVYEEGSFVYAFKMGKGPVFNHEPKGTEGTALYRADLARLAREGYDPIVAVGFAYEDAVRDIASYYTSTRFTLIDAVVDLPNVQSVKFAEHEGSFLVGALAGLKTESNVVGFVGGMNIPLIHRFACGYAQGVKLTNPSATILGRFVGDSYLAWSNPRRGAELTVEQYQYGADIVFAAAGGSSVGVYKTAQHYDATDTDFPTRYAIAVDSNQNSKFENSILTSMLKNVGRAAIESFEDAANGTWKPGLKIMDLRAEGVDWALDIFNEGKIPLNVVREIDQIKANIAKGSLQIGDYDTEESCPVTILWEGDVNTSANGVQRTAQLERVFSRGTIPIEFDELSEVSQ
ncbi:BMP family protein [Reinekea sp. G2M2-21]|uniref:BMP family lipoprotein n=1 Tax=Reinekea sp. G2M2-21 TaxID=2788942 RepID=UPI0018A961D9|nr:BMP family ABC transporter substrate-binding protein [Reinekea sp. G2M2-21]